MRNLELAEGDWLMADDNAPEPQPKAKGIPNEFATKKRRNKRGMTVYVDPAAHEEIKSLVSERGGTIEDLWIEGMNLVLVKYGKKGIA